ncbi:hypothetical protein HCG51_20320 [Tolypothrix sp. PCC 7910]|uniref:patatin-like phospholipase family protein n=1 Tax=Tolypothrix sp. PCC 7910 TaxID=2099387 RepID=UPI001427913D|nr:patatin-like phospholipase family protein [Tolypothrix sp. PCC 7910]QIR38814.1 hypothetical protein HCG51_20320 [Tolypothrix sp. PCC 7910]
MDTVRILSIDGGGIRGIIPLKVLEYIEEVTGQQIHQLFDVVGGTSTGGIIALGLNSKLPGTNEIYTAKQLLDFYTSPEDIKQIFQVENSTLVDKILNFVRRILHILPEDHGPGFLAAEYSSQSINNFLQSKFGQHTKLSQLPTECDVSVFSYDIENASPYYFNNHQALQNCEDDYYVWQAARATSAAPTYFSAEEVDNLKQQRRVLVDGGVFINNPTLEMLIRAKELYPNAKKYLLVSLGTGEFTQKYTNLNNAGVVNWLWLGAPLVNISMTGVSMALDQQLQKLKKEISGLDYQRYQQPLTENIGLDDAKPETISLLQKLGAELVEQNQKQLKNLCKELSLPLKIKEHHYA